jgi:hypothetical protein
MIIKDQLSCAQEQLDSVKLINKLLQEDLDLLRANLEELNGKCTNNGNNDKMLKWLEVSNEVRKSDQKIIYPAFEHIPVIINQKTETGLWNGCKIDQGYKTKTNKLLLANETSSKVNQKEKRNFILKITGKIRY